MKFIELIKEDEEIRQYKKAQTVYKALRKGSATVSVNVAYIERNGVESHTFEYILPKENYKINVVNLRGNTSTHIRCEKMIIVGKKIPIMDTLIIGAVRKRFSKDFEIDLIINDIEYTEEGVRNDGLLNEEPNERELEIQRLIKKSETVYKALKKGTGKFQFSINDNDIAHIKYELPDEFKLKILGSMSSGMKPYIKIQCDDVKVTILNDIRLIVNTPFNISWSYIKNKFEKFDVELSCLNS